MALGGDILLLGIEAAAGLNPFTDMAQRPILYVYVLLGTVVAFGVFGAMVGSHEDQLEQMALRESLTGCTMGAICKWPEGRTGRGQTLSYARVFCAV